MRLLAVLKHNENIPYYLLAGGISKLGDILSGLAFLFLAYDLTGSELHTTGMAIVETLPYLLFGLIGGVLADWLPKKKLLIYLGFMRIPFVFSIVCMHYFDLLTYGYLLMASFLIQCIGCFFNPAHRSVLPAITKEGERMAANSLNDTFVRGVTVLSPIVSVWLLTSVGVVHFFSIATLTYAISIFFISKIHIREYNVQSNKSVKGVFRAIIEFIIWIRAQLTIKHLFMFTFMTVFFNTWAWEVGLLLALSEMSSSSEKIYSILQGIFGGIVIITNIIIPFLFKKLTLQHYMIGAFIWGIGITYYGLLYDVKHFFIGCAIVGIGLPIAGLARVYLLQSLVPKDKMGRAFSFNATLLYLSNTISLALYGVLVLYISIQHLMLYSGIMIIIVSLIGLIYKTVSIPKLGWRFIVNFLK